MIRVQPHGMESFHGTTFQSGRVKAERVKADGAFSCLGFASCLFKGTRRTVFAHGSTQPLQQGALSKSTFFVITVFFFCVWQVAPMATRHV